MALGEWDGRRKEELGETHRRVWERRKMKYGGIELGGTRIVYGIGD